MCPGGQAWRTGTAGGQEDADSGKTWKRAASAWPGVSWKPEAERRLIGTGGPSAGGPLHGPQRQPRREDKGENRDEGLRRAWGNAPGPGHALGRPSAAPLQRAWQQEEETLLSQGWSARQALDRISPAAHSPEGRLRDQESQPSCFLSLLH